MNSFGRCFSVGVILCGAALSVSVRGDDMLVADCLGHSVHRYDENGQWLGDFVPPGGGGLRFPHSIIWGPDLNDDGMDDVYVVGLQSAAVHCYDGVTGAPIGDGVFASGGMFSPVDLDWGPDRNDDGVPDLYVLNNASSIRVVWYDGVTGDFGGGFITGNSGGFVSGEFLVFGPDITDDGVPEIYGTSAADNRIYRFNGATGAFIDRFVQGGAGYVTGRDLLFHTDGRLYVCNGGGNSIISFDGETGGDAQVFVPSRSGGLSNPHGLIWGPDANDDGEKDLYVASQANARVIRYDGLTGDFIDVFIPSGRGGIVAAAGIIFVSTGCTRDPEWLCDGDVDGDGQVNPVDSGLVQAAFGSADEQDLCNFDVDCDGQINPVDAGIVQSLFGTCDAPRGACP